MKLSEKLQDVLNKQVNHEFYAGYLYLSMAAYFESESLRGFAHWMKKQAEEEKGHAIKLFNFILDRRGKVTLTAIDAPKTKWASPLEAFQDALKHEMKVTELINGMVSAAMGEGDYATANFLQWFVDEQVEEEASAAEIVDKLKMIGEHKAGLLMLDRELAKRE